MKNLTFKSWNLKTIKGIFERTSLLEEFPSILTVLSRAIKQIDKNWLVLSFIRSPTEKHLTRVDVANSWLSRFFLNLSRYKYGADGQELARIPGLSENIDGKTVFRKVKKFKHENAIILWSKEKFKKLLIR